MAPVESDLLVAVGPVNVIGVSRVLLRVGDGGRGRGRGV